MQHKHYLIVFIACVSILLPCCLSLCMKSFASKKVVIVGGGIGGLSSAFDCKHLLDSSDQVTVISERDHFEFTPSNPCKLSSG